MATYSRAGGVPVARGRPCSHAAVIAAASSCSRRAPTASVMVRTVLADTWIAAAASVRLAAASANGRRAPNRLASRRTPGL
jgi:hypothetical protein